MKQKVRKAAWSGQFYPAPSAVLESMIQGFLDKVTVQDNNNKPIGIIAPHAGYAYSGQTAAAAFAYIQEQEYETVVVIAPSHAELIDGVSVFDGDSYSTPLGSIPVNVELAKEICQHGNRLNYTSIGHSKYTKRPEHALEVQLPFLQYLLKDTFSIVPIVFHDYEWQLCSDLGMAIAESIADVHKTLLVASTDLYHGYSYDECKRVDDMTVHAIQDFDPQVFMQGIHDDIYQACGAGPVAAVQVAAKAMGANKVRIIDQTTSADQTGIRGDWTVGYVSALVTE